jgi:predicted alpha/beta-fold hydrolase
LGISIGANFITNYAARKDCLLKGFVALANPFDLVKTTDHLANQRNPLWGYFMATN